MSSSLTLEPIGFVHTQKRVKFQTRHQPEESQAEENVLELVAGRKFEQALQDLAGFSRIWLVWWFHRNTEWRPLVLPPRGKAVRRGVFATRSPHRPNPLGITPVQLLRIEGRKLFLGACDLVDGTPVFDLKPYIPAYDIFPAEKAGWIDEVEAGLARKSEYAVGLTPLAQEQLAWLETHWRIDFRTRMFELLSHDPSVHRTRRISRREPGLYVIGCGAWRATFTLTGKTVTITQIEAGYARRFLLDPARAEITDREAQVAFTTLWLERPPAAVKRKST